MEWRRRVQNLSNESKYISIIRSFCLCCYHYNFVKNRWKIWQILSASPSQAPCAGRCENEEKKCNVNCEWTRKSLSSWGSPRQRVENQSQSMQMNRRREIVLFKEHHSLWSLNSILRGIWHVFQAFSVLIFLQLTHFICTSSTLRKYISNICR